MDAAADDPAWAVALVTGASTLLAALGALGLALLLLRRAAGRAAADAAALQDRRDRRYALIEVIDAGTDWCRGQEAQFRAAGMPTDRVEPRRRDVEERHEAARRRYAHALVTARLTVPDPDAAPILAELSRALDKSHLFADPVATSLRSQGVAEDSLVAAGLAFVASTRAAITLLENQSLGDGRRATVVAGSAPAAPPATSA